MCVCVCVKKNIDMDKRYEARWGGGKGAKGGRREKGEEEGRRETGRKADRNRTHEVRRIAQPTACAMLYGSCIAFAVYHGT